MAKIMIAPKEEVSLDSQIRAIGMAIREAERDLLKAKQNGNEEWIQDAKFVVDGLTSARNTINGVKMMKALLSQEII